VHKCPFDAVKIIGLPRELEGELAHQFGKNGFRLYRLPVPKKGQVIGLPRAERHREDHCDVHLIRSAGAQPRDYEGPGKWTRSSRSTPGSEIHDYFVALANGKLKTAMKPQYVDMLPTVHKGEVRKLLQKVDDRGVVDDVAERLAVKNVLSRDIAKLSGESCSGLRSPRLCLKDADVYFFDEPSSYLDIYQRLEIAKVIQELSVEKQVVVIEHDLAVMDFLSDLVHIMYGEEGAYGVMAQPRAVRTAINVYLEG